jgi:hypothetical protein
MKVKGAVVQWCVRLVLLSGCGCWLLWGEGAFVKWWGRTVMEGVMEAGESELGRINSRNWSLKILLKELHNVCGVSCLEEGVCEQG